MQRSPCDFCACLIYNRVGSYSQISNTMMTSDMDDINLYDAQTVFCHILKPGNHPIRYIDQYPSKYHNGANTHSHSICLWKVAWPLFFLMNCYLYFTIMRNEGPIYYSKAFIAWIERCSFHFKCVTHGLIIWMFQKIYKHGKTHCMCLCQQKTT